MKNKVLRLITITLALVASLAGFIPAHGKALASPATNYMLDVPEECDSQDTEAPCIEEVFTEDPVMDGPLMVGDDGQLSSSMRYTCGVVVKDVYRNIVAKLWETVTVKWNSGYTLDGAYRSLWVKNSIYGWTDLAGPSPRFGSFGRGIMTTVETSGKVTYFGGRWHSYTIWLTFSGYVNDPYWHCSLIKNW